MATTKRHRDLATAGAQSAARTRRGARARVASSAIPAPRERLVPASLRASVRPARRGGFSLAELMIALAILAMGLLVIGASLPIGVRYSRDSVNMALGEAAVEHALDLIEQTVNQPNSLAPDGISLSSQATIFAPRFGLSSFAALARGYEPLIKVRALFPRSISAHGMTSGSEEADPPPLGVLTEEVVRTWLTGFFPAATHTGEVDPTPGADGGPWLGWALPSIAMVYPPVLPEPSLSEPPLTAEDYVLNELNRYDRRPLSVDDPKRALDRRIAWAAFYRRVSYAPGSDPELYEFVTVAARLPSAKHCFPVQDPCNPALALANVGTLAPIPWLVAFDANQQLPYPPQGFDLQTGDPLPVGTAPATLRFKCYPNLSGLFPVGSIFIPARNDRDPNAVSGDIYSLVGFGPPAPDALPIYEVAERPDETTVVTKFNGYYPMAGRPDLSGAGYCTSPDPSYWPVWVIPPAVEEFDSNGAPVWPNRSTNVAISRRIVRLERVE